MFTASVTLGDRVESGVVASPKRTLEDMVPLMVSLTGKLGKRIADIDEIYVTTGPGSNTGLRMAITFARVIFALKPAVRIFGGSTFDMLLAGADVEDGVTVISDRHQAFFYAVFKGGKKVADGRVEQIADLPLNGLKAICADTDEPSIAALPDCVKVDIRKALLCQCAFVEFTPDRVGELVPLYSEKI